MRIPPNTVGPTVVIVIVLLFFAILVAWGVAGDRAENARDYDCRQDALVLVDTPEGWMCAEVVRESTP